MQSNISIYFPIETPSVRRNPSLRQTWLMLRLLSRAMYLSLQKADFKTAKRIIVLTLATAGKNWHILLADDDEDDRDFFIETIGDVSPESRVNTVDDGEQLIRWLNNATQLPDLIFLDLNMPCKNGQECLIEIRNNKKLQHIPVIIYSTSSSREHIEETYQGGANLYVRKPDSYGELKSIARKVLSFDWSQQRKPAKDEYILNPKSL